MRGLLTWAVLIAASAVVGLALGLASRAPSPRSPTEVIAWTDSLYEVHAVWAQGELSSGTTEDLAAGNVHGPLILVDLRGIDLRSCGDLGRQLRELENRLGSDYPIIVPRGLEPDAEEIEWFLRSERLSFTVIQTRGLLRIWRDETELPKPSAIWVDDDLSRGIGVGHLRRAPYVRPRSFADELEQRLSDERRLPMVASALP